MGLHDVRFFLCPCVLSVETLKFDNQRVLAHRAAGFFGGWGTPFTLLRRECVDRTGFPGIVVLHSTDLLERCVYDDPP